MPGTTTADLRRLLLVANRALIAARDEGGGRPDDAEVIGTLLLMVVAGHETTLNLVTTPSAPCAPTATSSASSSTAWAQAVEETLRWDSPVSAFPFRYATRDLTLRSTVIPAGLPVLAAYSAAGRDRAAHGPDADRFDVTRAGPRPLSLGHGPHYCLGAPLARLEATVAPERLFGRFPELTLAEPEETLPPAAGFVGNSVGRLPVRLR